MTAGVAPIRRELLHSRGDPSLNLCPLHKREQTIPSVFVGGGGYMTSGKVLLVAAHQVPALLPQ